MAELTFIPKAIELVKQAVAEDNAENYEKAKFLYTQSLEYVNFGLNSLCLLLLKSSSISTFFFVSYFMTGLKYEKNERSKQAIRERMKEYMVREWLNFPKSWITSDFSKRVLFVTILQNRAEQIDALIKEQQNPPEPAAAAKKKGSAAAKGGKAGGGAAGSGKGKDDGDDDDDKEDPESKKLQEALSHAIVSERPNIKWCESISNCFHFCLGTG